jgi:glycerol uptake facilitator-like aquaporin
MSTIFIVEMMGTMFLILLGNGVVANILLKKQEVMAEVSFPLQLPGDLHSPEV